MSSILCLNTLNKERETIDPHFLNSLKLSITLLTSSKTNFVKMPSSVTQILIGSSAYNFFLFISFFYNKSLSKDLIDWTNRVITRLTSWKLPVAVKLVVPLLFCVFS